MPKGIRLLDVERTTYLYKATNKVNGHSYVGVSYDHKNRRREHIRDAKKGKGYAFQSAIRKYGEDNFEWKVLSICRNARIALGLEVAAIQLGMGYYNMTKGGEGFTMTEETIEKIRKANLGRKHTPQAIANMTAAQRLLDKSLTDAQKKAIGDFHRGKILSEETRRKMSEAHTGKVFTEEHKRKIGDNWIGRKHTDETKAKMSVSARKKPPVTEEARKNMSEAQKGKKMSEENRQKLIERNTGRAVSQETREKMSKALTGKKPTEETRAKLSAAQFARAAREEQESLEKHQNLVRINLLPR